MDNMLNTRIGILGGGQLGKMLIESYSGLNIKYTVLEKDKGCPASLVCPNIVEGSLYDENSIGKIAEEADVMTYEIEHLDIKALEKHSAKTLVIPYPSVLKVIQDKGLQKEFYTDAGVDTLDYILVRAEDLKTAIDDYKHERFVLKHRKGGYDGKGVQLLSKSEFYTLLLSNDESLKSKEGYVIEELCENAREVSVIVAVCQSGDIACYDCSEMVFDAEANLMDYLISPASLPTELEVKAKELAVKAVSALKSPGIFAVELFLDADEKFYVNEIAPRPHNSGHHTIESTYTSQYEQLNRILLNLPLGSTKRLSCALTANILGPKNVNGEYYVSGLTEVFKIEGVYLHLYGKTSSKPYRKLGHFTVLAENNSECIKKMNKVREHLRIKSID